MRSKRVLKPPLSRHIRYILSENLGVKYNFVSLQPLLKERTNYSYLAKDIAMTLTALYHKNPTKIRRSSTNLALINQSIIRSDSRAILLINEVTTKPKLAYDYYAIEPLIRMGVCI